MKIDTPETDAVREMWFIKPNVELGDGRPIHGNVVDVEFARRMERERNAAREAYEAETLSTFEMGKEILKLEADVNLWRNRHSELFMKLNPITEASESQRKADEFADGKPDGQEENTSSPHPCQEPPTNTGGTNR